MAPLLLYHQLRYQATHVAGSFSRGGRATGVFILTNLGHIPEMNVNLLSIMELERFSGYQSIIDTFTAIVRCGSQGGIMTCQYLKNA